MAQKKEKELVILAESNDEEYSTEFIEDVINDCFVNAKKLAVIRFSRGDFIDKVNTIAKRIGIQPMCTLNAKGYERYDFIIATVKFYKNAFDTIVVVGPAYNTEFDTVFNKEYIVGRRPVARA